MELRPYQQEAVNAAVQWISKSLHPAVLELATGAGKSLVLAAIGNWLINRTKAKVLCLAPSRELVEQNAQKYAAMYGDCSIYSASISKSIRYNMVYGTPQSVANALNLFDGNFYGVLVDEAGETTPTVRKIIAHIRNHNPRLRVIGVTATPYTMGGGYIYEVDQNNTLVEEANEPYYKKLICRITTKQLIDDGYLTPPNLDPKTENYDTSKLKLASTGNFTANSVREAFEGKRQLTAQIINDIMQHSVNRNGVMVFAATVRHAKEIYAMLPPEESELIGGDTNMGNERPEVISAFKDQQIKYLVSVGTLTRGFDATHVDVIAVMRATESPVLFQQVIGRGLRLHDNKKDVLVLDYGGNIERHGLEDDLFTPKIRSKKSTGDSEPLAAKCELCNSINLFTRRKNEHGYDIDENGYFRDLSGRRVKENEKDFPAHYGRRCKHITDVTGEFVRCEYRWSYKLCEHCDGENDIAARYCEHCKSELIDPERKLELEFKRMKSDPSAITTDYVRSWKVSRWTTRKGDDSVRIDFQTDYRRIAAWFMPKQSTKWEAICKTVYGKVAPDVETFITYINRGAMPKTITSYKANNGYYQITAFNKPTDEENINAKST